MMTWRRGIQTDRGRRSRELGSRNEQSGNILALSHEQTESKKGRQKEREANCREKRSRADLQTKAASSKQRQRESESL